jgi:acetoin utilization protein AcuB
MIEDRPGSIKEITDIIRQYHARLVSIMTTYEKAPPRYRYLYIRTFNIDRKRLPDMKRDLNSMARMLYMVDLREGTRNTYASY